MMRGMMKMALMLGLVASAAIGVGCGSSGMGRYDVNVALDPAVATAQSVPTIAVNIFGANSVEEARWASESMTNYWMPGGQLRQEFAGQIKEFNFGPGATQAQTLSRNDPIWETWQKHGAQTLFIVANLPGGHEDKPGAADSRRLILPLAKDRWQSGQAIQITVQRGRIRADTQPLPPKQ